jgi:GlcNAc-PI de-N-acetylase
VKNMGRLRPVGVFLVGLIVILAFGGCLACTSGGLEIVAHQDDDFLFMNPDVQNQIAEGLQTVTVYMTAGESTGNAVDYCQTTPCPGRLARDRQLGIRAAYAQMDGLPPDVSGGYESYWSAALWRPDGVHWVERYTLIPDSRINLIFMNLHDEPDPPIYSLTSLLYNPTFVAPMVVPDGSALASIPSDQLTYNYAGVVAVLKAILVKYQPAIVRTLDPEPFQIIVGGKYVVSFDNADHTAAAQFMNQVLTGYHGPNGTKRWSLTNYKGYSISDYRPNLGAADVASKTATALTYQPHDDNYKNNDYTGWYQATYERYPGTTRWLAPFPNGLLAAFTVENLHVEMWHETTPGGAWTGPVTLDNPGPVTPAVTVVRLKDGRLQLFALRSPVDETVQQDVITSVQVTGSMSFGTWTSLGNPNSSNCGLGNCRWMGSPTAAVDGAGRVFVFVKGSDGQIYSKYLSNGIWSPWVTMTTSLAYGNAQLDILDGIAAATRPDGRLEVFATSRSGYIQRHLEDAATPTFNSVYSFPVGAGGSDIVFGASAPTLTRNADGRLELFYREQGKGRVITYYTTTSGGWAGPVLLYGDSGVGPVAAIDGSGGYIELFERNVWNGISATWQIAPNEVFQLQWTILGGYILEYPAAATDALGEDVLMVKGMDGKLYVSRAPSGQRTFSGFSPIWPH